MNSKNNTAQLITKFDISEEFVLRMCIFFDGVAGFILFSHSNELVGKKPDNMPLSYFLKCLYRFNRVLNQMFKPIENVSET